MKSSAAGLGVTLHLDEAQRQAFERGCSARRALELSEDAFDMGPYRRRADLQFACHFLVAFTQTEPAQHGGLAFGEQLSLLHRRFCACIAAFCSGYHQIYCLNIKAACFCLRRE